MTLLVAALLGVLQGLTEFLPVSSTAHLLIAGDLAGFEDPGEAYTILIQLGSILAIMWLFRARIWSVLTGLPSDPAARRFALMVLIAFLPAVVAGVLFNDFVDEYLTSFVDRRNQRQSEGRQRDCKQHERQRLAEKDPDTAAAEDQAAAQVVFQHRAEHETEQQRRQFEPQFTEEIPD